MAFTLSDRSQQRLAGVHPDLALVVKAAIAITAQDFFVAEGLRTKARQQELVAKGASKTMASKHLLQTDGFGHAVDLYPAGYQDLNKIPKDAYRAVHTAMMTAAEQLGVGLRWGNDWDGDGVEVGPDPDESFEDWPHYELKGA